MSSAKSQSTEADHKGKFILKQGTLEGPLWSVDCGTSCNESCRSRLIPPFTVQCKCTCTSNEIINNYKPNVTLEADCFHHLLYNVHVQVTFSPLQLLSQNLVNTVKKKNYSMM